MEHLGRDTTAAGTTRSRRGARHLPALALLALAICSPLFIGVPVAAAEGSGPPIDATAPAISGKTVDEASLASNTGHWDGLIPISYGYRWELCEASGEGCTAISGATSHKYKLQHEDVGRTLRVLVTATNSEGSASATSKPTAVIAASKPVRLKPPVLGGAAVDGKVMTAGTGTWKGTPPFDYTYQWKVCVKLECTSIAGATQSSYRVTTPEIGKQLRVTVTAANSLGGAANTSASSKRIIGGPPVDIEAPSVSGAPLDGQTLSAGTGTWAGTPPMTFSYQWLSCPLLSETCTPIAGANGPTYTAGPLDVGNAFEVEVTATSGYGSATAVSGRTSVVSALLPGNTLLPKVSGLLQDGQLLSAVAGAWSGTEPIAYSYQWELCNAAGEACNDIDGAVGDALALVSGYVGSTVRLMETATNSAGSVSAVSEPTSIVAALLPSNTQLPSVGGLPQDGQQLLASVGSWSGTTPISYSYQWELCNGAGESCKNIEDAVEGALALVSDDVGSTLRVAVTATNSGGSTTATSPATGLIAALLPSNTTLPSIAGVAEDGQKLAGAIGAWSGTTPMSYSYQWEQCNASGGECKALGGETSETLGLVSSLVKSTVRLVVTARNSGGSTQATSAPTSPVLAALPVNEVLPTISGLLKLGEKLFVHHEEWKGTAPLGYTYQWQLCGVLGLVGECKNISGATGEDLLLELLDVGLTLRVGVTAHNERGASETVYSKVTGLIQGLGLSPSKGAAGTDVILDGAGIDAAKSVNFGSEQVEPEVKSPTEIVAEAPAGSGTVPVTVSTPEGSTHETPSDQFTYSP